MHGPTNEIPHTLTIVKYHKFRRNSRERILHTKATFRQFSDTDVARSHDKALILPWVGKWLDTARSHMQNPNELLAKFADALHRRPHSYSVTLHQRQDDGAQITLELQRRLLVSHRLPEPRMQPLSVAERAVLREVLNEWLPSPDEDDDIPPGLLAAYQTIYAKI